MMVEIWLKNRAYYGSVPETVRKSGYTSAWSGAVAIQDPDDPIPELDALFFSGNSGWLSKLLKRPLRVSDIITVDGTPWYCCDFAEDDGWEIVKWR